MVRLAPLLAAMLSLSTGCGGPATPATDPVVGLIVQVDGPALTLETTEGARFAFEIADPTVTLSHLREHLDERLPVSVDWDGTDPIRAVKIDDA